MIARNENLVSNKRSIQNENYWRRRRRRRHTHTQLSLQQNKSNWLTFKLTVIWIYGWSLHGSSWAITSLICIKYRCLSGTFDSCFLSLFFSFIVATSVDLNQCNWNRLMSNQPKANESSNLIVVKFEQEKTLKIPTNRYLTSACHNNESK